MGSALIVGGGKDGRYTIRLHWGVARRAAILAAIDQALAALQASLVQQQAAVASADAAEEAMRAQLELAFQSIVEQLQINPGGATAAEKAFEAGLNALRALQVRHAPARIALQTMQAARADALARRAYWDAFVAEETRPAWCCDHTETAAGTVATVDIDGESELLLIAPGGRGWQPGDGVLSARELMSPATAFFNAALLPGWQKYKPTWRWGTLTAIDWEGNTGNVTLHAAQSSAQRLGINQAPQLAGVRFAYMQTDCRAFNDDSRVVVQFEGQEWAQPVIIGFLDNPRPDPPTFGVGGDIGDGNYTEGDAVSADLSGYWQWGAEPLTYQLVEGTLPAGLTLDEETGVLAGTPSAAGTSSGLVVRCLDALFDEARNRRYHDSNAFSITVYGGWAFFDVSLDLLAHSATENIQVRLEVDLFNEFLQVGRATTFYRSWPQEPVDYTQADADTWVEGSELPGFPDLYCRVNWTGDEDMYSGPALNTWVSFAAAAVLEWSFNDLVLAAGTYSGTYTLEVSTSASGTPIVSTISGSIEATLVD